MKKFILCAIVILINANAYAHGDPHICSLKASVFETAATARDNQLPPQTVLDMVAAYKDVSLSFKKKAINLVYFDKRFFYAGGHALFSQIMNICQNGPNKFKPLK